MNTYILADGEWVPGQPSQGQKFKRVDNKGGEIVSFYSGAAPTQITKLTRIKFKQRLTQAERITVRMAAQSDPIIFDFMDLVSEATYIDLSLPETLAGVNYLESEGCIATGRANQILNTPITPAEAYNG